MRVCASHNQDLPCIQGVHPHPTPRMGPVFPVRRKRTRSSYAVQMGQTSHKGHRCSRGTNTPARPGRQTARPAPQRRSSRTTGTSPGGRRTGGDGAGGARPGGPPARAGGPGRLCAWDAGTRRAAGRPEGRRANLTDGGPTSRTKGRPHGPPGRPHDGGQIATGQANAPLAAGIVTAQSGQRCDRSRHRGRSCFASGR